MKGSERPRAVLVAPAVVCLLGTASLGLAQSTEGEQQRLAPSTAPVVKAIEISPLKYTRESMVLEALVSRVGEPHSEANNEKDVSRLDRLGFFSEAKLETAPMEDGLALKVDLVETTPYLPNVGVGHSEENGFAIGPGLKVLNLAHTGLGLGAGLRFGGWTSAHLNVSSPSIPGGHWTWDVLLAYQDREDTLNGFQRQTFNGALFLGKTIGESRTLRGIVQLASTKSNVDGITLSDTNRDDIPSLGVELIYDTRDRWSDPHSGWRNTVDVRRAFGDASYWRLQIDHRHYLPLADRHSIDVISLTNAHSGELDVGFPSYLQSYVGGTNSVRGWELGARVGKNEMLNTVAYRYELMKRKTWKIWKVAGYVGLELAAFGDLGIAWTRSREFAANNFIGGYGVGLRFLVPWVSEIRLDVAAGAPGEGWRFHFGFGPKSVSQKAAAR